MRTLSRRRLLALSGAVLPALVGCGTERGARSEEVPPGSEGMTDVRDARATSPAAAQGILASRPGEPPHSPVRPGTHPIDAGSGSGLLHVPRAYDVTRPAALIVTLHGAGGTAEHGLGPLLEEAATRSALLLAPTSARATWDAIGGAHGPDVVAIDELLDRTFATYAVDPERVAVSGFSDGASYALSLGLANGDLFGSVLAFSPGFVPPGARRGRPEIFVSHGTLDRVLPIDRCSRRLVPELRRAGYRVEYREFEGPHTVPPTLAAAAVDRVLDGAAGS